eukprot:364774-Chlamydomonas_euryale.AAC.6
MAGYELAVHYINLVERLAKRLESADQHVNSGLLLTAVLRGLRRTSGLSSRRRRVLVQWEHLWLKGVPKEKTHTMVCTGANSQDIKQLCHALHSAGDKISGFKGPAKKMACSFLASVPTRGGSAVVPTKDKRRGCMKEYPGPELNIKMSFEPLRIACSLADGQIDRVRVSNMRPWVQLEKGISVKQSACTSVDRRWELGFPSYLRKR